MSTLLRFEQGPCPADVSFLLPPTRGISIISHQLPRTSGYCNPLRRFVLDCLEPLFIVFFSVPNLNRSVLCSQCDLPCWCQLHANIFAIFKCPLAALCLGSSWLLPWSWGSLIRAAPLWDCPEPLLTSPLVPGHYMCHYMCWWRFQDVNLDAQIRHGLEIVYLVKEGEKGNFYMGRHATCIDINMTEVIVVSQDAKILYILSRNRESPEWWVIRSQRKTGCEEGEIRAFQLLPLFVVCQIHQIRWLFLQYREIETSPIVGHELDCLLKPFVEVDPLQSLSWQLQDRTTGSSPSLHAIWMTSLLCVCVSTHVSLCCRRNSSFFIRAS